MECLRRGASREGEGPKESTAAMNECRDFWARISDGYKDDAAMSQASSA